VREGTTLHAPVLRLFAGCPIILNSNDHKAQGVVKGTIGYLMGLQLKDGCTAKEEIWSGYKVLTMTANQVECNLCKKDCSEEVFFTLLASTSKVAVRLKLHDMPEKKYSLHITQFPLNNNIAMTGHKLQGMTKENIIVWNFTNLENWVYVVLSRVRTLVGLYLMKPLDPKKINSSQARIYCLKYNDFVIWKR
jgi:ATP-dependent exoDNAse (exonuclease V) alpha subunit